MCDYSLMARKTEIAKTGDQLKFGIFPGQSVGLAYEGGPSDVAICVPPGAKLLLTDIPEGMRTQYLLGKEEQVVFTQLNLAKKAAHHDAVIFHHGTPAEKTIWLQEFRGGGRAKVLSTEGASLHVEVQEPELVYAR